MSYGKIAIVASFYLLCGVLIGWLFKEKYDEIHLKSIRVNTLATTDFCDKRDYGYSEEGCIWQRLNYPLQHPTCGGKYEASCKLESIFDR